VVPRLFFLISAALAALIAGSSAHVGVARAQTVVHSSPAVATPVADSATRLNRLGKWDDAATLARATLRANVGIDEQCGLLFSLAYADAHIGRLDDAGATLEKFFERCRTVASATQYESAAADLHREVELPPLPRTGLDFSGVDAFWPVADILAADREPSEAEWTALFRTTGYRMAVRVSSTLRRDMEIALRPSRRAALDSLRRLTANSVPSRAEHLANVYADRAALTAYRDSVAHGLPIERATARTSRFLPPHATDGKAPPPVVFAFFADDAYSLPPDAIVVDMEHVRVGTDLTLMLAHELHHWFLAGLDALNFPSGPDPSVGLVRALTFARNEGIADLIDKPYPLSRQGTVGAVYSRMYNEAYARTPAVIRSIDSALVVAAEDSTKLQAVGMRVQQLLPSSGHFNGSYVAREIYETFGVDSLFPGIANPFAFWRAYAEAEVKRGNPNPFSPKAVALLNALEKKYLAPGAAPGLPGNPSRVR
jgi:hypothetical protein